MENQLLTDGPPANNFNTINCPQLTTKSLYFSLTQAKGVFPGKRGLNYLYVVVSVILIQMFSLCASMREGESIPLPLRLITATLLAYFMYFAAALNKQLGRGGIL